MINSKMLFMPKSSRLQCLGCCAALSIRMSFTWSFTWLVTPTMMMIMDDYAAHQTLVVSIKKPISMARTFCKRALNEFTEVASIAFAGRLFHLFTTSSEKK